MPPNRHPVVPVGCRSAAAARAPRLRSVPLGLAASLGMAACAPATPSGRGTSKHLERVDFTALARHVHAGTLCHPPFSRLPVPPAVDMTAAVSGDALWVAGGKLDYAFDAERSEQAERGELFRRVAKGKSGLRFDGPWHRLTLRPFAHHRQVFNLRAGAPLLPGLSIARSPANPPDERLMLLMPGHGLMTIHHDRSQAATGTGNEEMLSGYPEDFDTFLVHGEMIALQTNPLTGPLPPPYADLPLRYKAPVDKKVQRYAIASLVAHASVQLGGDPSPAQTLTAVVVKSRRVRPSCAADARRSRFDVFVSVPVAKTAGRGFNASGPQRRWYRLHRNAKYLDLEFGPFALQTSNPRVTSLEMLPLAHGGIVLSEQHYEHDKNRGHAILLQGATLYWASPASQPKRVTPPAGQQIVGSATQPAPIGAGASLVWLLLCEAGRKAPCSYSPYIASATGLTPLDPARGVDTLPTDTVPVDPVPIAQQPHAAPSTQTGLRHSDLYFAATNGSACAYAPNAPCGDLKHILGAQHGCLLDGGGLALPVGHSPADGHAVAICLPKSDHPTAQHGLLLFNLEDYPPLEAMCTHRAPQPARTADEVLATWQQQAEAAGLLPLPAPAGARKQPKDAIACQPGSLKAEHADFCRQDQTLDFDCNPHWSVAEELIAAFKTAILDGFASQSTPAEPQDPKTAEDPETNEDPETAEDPETNKDPEADRTPNQAPRQASRGLQLMWGEDRVAPECQPAQRRQRANFIAKLGLGSMIDAEHLVELKFGGEESLRRGPNPGGTRGPLRDAARRGALRNVLPAPKRLNNQIGVLLEEAVQKAGLRQRKCFGTPITRVVMHCRQTTYPRHVNAGL